jgi:hypothetical protein
MNCLSADLKKFLFVFTIFVAYTFPVLGDSLEELTGAEQAAVLRIANEPVTAVQTKNPSPRLLPRHGELERFVSVLQSNLEPNILVENLTLYRKPASQENAAGWSKDEQTGLLNQLLALSTLTGIQYYSESRKTMRVFYESSQVIDSPSAKKPLPDPVYSVLPNSLVLYARQKDLTFGDNVYCYDFQTGADTIFFVQENLTAMNTGIIPAVGRNKFRSMIAIIDVGDSLLIYAAAMAKAASLPGIGDRIGASFTNRAKAILQWFTGRADKVFL